MIRVGAAWHQIVPSPFGGCLGEERRLDFIEPMIIHKITEMASDIAAHLHALLHQGPSKIDVAIAKSCLLTHLNIAFKGERRSFRLIEDLKCRGQHLNLAGREVDILGAFRTGPNLAMNLQNKLTPNRFSQAKGLLIVRIKDDLNQSFPITKIDENNAPVVATPMNPAAKIDFEIQMAFGYFSTVVATHDSFPGQQKVKALNYKASRPYHTRLDLARRGLLAPIIWEPQPS